MISLNYPKKKQSYKQSKNEIMSDIKNSIDNSDMILISKLHEKR